LNGNAGTIACGGNLEKAPSGRVEFCKCWKVARGAGGSWHLLLCCQLLECCWPARFPTSPPCCAELQNVFNPFVFSFSFGFAAEQTFVAICDLLTSPAAAADPDLQRDF
jgi:hypothetical protein